MTLNQTVFNSFPELKTERLTLRMIQLQDAEQIFEMRSNGMVNRFIPRPTMTEVESAKDLVTKTNNAFDNKQAIGWAGLLRDNNEIIGTCGYNMIDWHNMRAELGGELTTTMWGKNIAIEAVKAIIKFGLEEINLHSIEAKVSPENRGAIYILESLGFEKEAHFKDRVYFNNQFSDMAVYTLIKGNEKL